ncbi:MAG: alanine-tRNA synthetase second additional domain-containing protein, partial [Firmicutes bacterium]|nr:alanine-tRNA synthetase second additional domain-containing protein [Bacillota bacterium]
LEGMGMEKPEIHSDVKRGFVLEFPEIPQLDLDAVEAMVREYISQDVPISYHDEEHIKIGETVYPCSGPRIHVRHAGEIEEFRLMKGFRYDPIARLYLLAGLVGAGADQEASEAGGAEDQEELLWLEWS